MAFVIPYQCLGRVEILGCGFCWVLRVTDGVDKALEVWYGSFVAAFRLY